MDFHNYQSELNQLLFKVDPLPVNQIINHLYYCTYNLSYTKKSVFICGNGGSHTNAAHFAQDLKKTCYVRANCLGDDITSLLAYSNDDSFEYAYGDMLAIANKYDILLVFTGSGNSKNIIRSQIVALEKEMIVIAFTGFDGGKSAKLCNYNIHVPSDNMRLVETAHNFLFHYIVDSLEKEIKPS